MKIKRLKNRLCAIGLIASLVLTLLSGIKMGQYKAAHAASQNNILEASDTGGTVSYSTILFSGEKVTVNLTGHCLVVTIDGIPYTFKDTYENEDAVEKCIVDKKEKLLHIATEDPYNSPTDFLNYYCMDLQNGTYMQVYKNITNDIYALSSNLNAHSVVIDAKVPLDNEYYASIYADDLFYLGSYLSSWMNHEEYDYIFFNTDPSVAATCLDNHYIASGEDGTLSGGLSVGAWINVDLSDSVLTVDIDYGGRYARLIDVSAVSLDTSEDLLHIFDLDGYYSCMDLRTGDRITVYQDSQSGEYCTSSFENAVRTSSKGSKLAANNVFCNTKYFLQFMYYLSNSDNDAYKVIRRKRLLTRYEYNQLSEGISPCNGTVYCDQDQITYNRGTKRTILFYRYGLIDEELFQGYGLDQYGTVWLMSTNKNLYWYNEKIADEVEALGDTLNSARLLRKDNRIVTAAYLCRNDSESVITGYYDMSTLAIEELPNPDELRETLGLSSQPTKTPDSGSFVTTEPKVTGTPLPPEPASFEATLMGAFDGYNVGYWGEGAEGTTPEVVGTKDEVTGAGQYTVGLDFTGIENGAVDSINLLALHINGAEPYYPERIIRVDKILINGESVDKDILAKAYTCSDNGLDTRVNLYNSFLPEDDAVNRPEARALVDHEDTTPWMLEDYAYGKIQIVALSFTYGTKSEIDAIDNPQTTSAPALGATGTPEEGATGTPGAGISGTPTPGTATKAPEELSNIKVPDSSYAKRMPTIASASNIKKTYGTKMFLLNVVTDSDGEVTYQSSNNKVVTVNSYGTVTIKGYGKASITVRTAETGEFRSASKTIKISIVPAKLKNFKAKSKSSGRITFTWKKQKLKNAKCQIQASSSAMFTSTRSVKPSPKLKKGKYVAGGLKRGSAYYFRARVVLKVSGKTYYSDWVKKKARIK